MKTNVFVLLKDMEDSILELFHSVKFWSPIKMQR